MDPLTIGILVFGTIFSAIMSHRQSKSTFDANKYLQDDAQDFNSVEAEKQRDWQEEFYNKYQSPEAMMNQYKSLGASDTAAIMASLGVSPTSPSPAAASSGANSMPFTGNTLAEMMGSLQNSVNSFYQNEKTKAEAENITEQTRWMPKLNQSTIDRTIAEMENWKGRLKLDNDIFREVTKPLVESTIGLNSVEIGKKRQEIQNLKQEYENAKAMYYNIQQDTRLKEAQTGLTQAQEVTEYYKQDNLSADTRLKNAETFGQQLQNQLTDLNVKISSSLGYNITLPPLNLAAAGFVAGEHALFDGVDKFFYKAGQAINGADAFLRMENSALDEQSVHHTAYSLTKKYFDSHANGKKFGFNPAYDKWLRERGKHFKSLENWINRNTRFGM